MCWPGNATSHHGNLIDAAQNDGKSYLRSYLRKMVREQKMTIESFRYFLGSKLGWVVTLSLAALGAYLLWTHTGHILYAAPYVLLLACPLMHLLGHRHGHAGKPENSND